MIQTMRLNKLFIASLLAFSTLALQSCLKDQEDFFDESSSERMQAVLENAKAVLTSSDNGWIFDYYPDRNLSYGGFVYTVKFDDKKVSVRSELAPEMEETSSYKLNTNNGPVLSFDSYNTLMHYFATPSSGEYEAQDGDFEFMIMNVTEDLITLRGNRTGNTMYLHRLNGDPEEYIKGIEKISNYNLITALSGTAGSTEITCENNANTRYMEFSCGGEDAVNTVGDYYLTTPTGIRFKDPIEINGATISEMAYTFDTATNSGVFTGEDSAGNQISLSGSLPATYAFFDEYIGNFSFSYYNGLRNINVTIEGDKQAGTYLIHGFNSNFDVVATYDKTAGCLKINSQLLGIEGSTGIWLASWALSAGGSLDWSPAYGVIAVKNPNTPGSYTITSNGSSLATDSFILWTTDLSGKSTGQLSNPNWMINGSTQLPYLTALVKR